MTDDELRIIKTRLEFAEAQIAALTASIPLLIGSVREAVSLSIALNLGHTDDAKKALDEIFQSTDAIFEKLLTALRPGYRDSDE